MSFNLESITCDVVSGERSVDQPASNPQPTTPGNQHQPNGLSENGFVLKDEKKPVQSTLLAAAAPPTSNAA